MSILTSEFYQFKKNFYELNGVSVHTFAVPYSVRVDPWQKVGYPAYGDIEGMPCTLNYLEKNNMNFQELLEQLKADQSALNKRSRILLQVNWNVYHLTELPIMVTFSFTDGVLASTSAETRRRYVSRTLNQPDVVDYIASVDYGKKNGREHYHALVWAKGDHFRADDWIKNYGYVYSQKVKGGDVATSAKYACKTAIYACKMPGVSIMTKRESPFHQARRELGTKGLRNSLAVSRLEKVFGDDVVEVAQ